MGPVRCRETPEGDLSQPVAENYCILSKVFALPVVREDASLDELRPLSQSGGVLSQTGINGGEPSELF